MFVSRSIKRTCLSVILFAVALSTATLPSAAQDPTTRSRAGAFQQQQTPATQKPKPKEEETLPSDDVVRVETNLTNFLFSAEDKHKRFISTLKAEDIRIYEDGKPQEVFTFQQNTDLPLSLAILIDCSASEERTLPEEKSAAREFLESVLRPNKDEAAIVTFTGEVTLEQGLTSSLDRLRRAVDRVEFVPPSGYIGGGVVVGTPPISGRNQELASSTAIWDAVFATSDELLGVAAEHTRRAIILVTDGDDTSSMMKMDRAIERAEKADSLIYAVGIGDRYHFGINEGALRKITDQTGGRAYFPRNERELREAFAQIQQDLREQYLVAYSSTNKSRDGSYRHIQVEVTNPELRKELKLTYRPGYFAKTQDAPAKPAK